MDQLVKAGWNAPLERPANLPPNYEESILSKKAWNIARNRPVTNYPEVKKPNANKNKETTFPDIPLPPDRKMPIVKQGVNITSFDEGEVILFYHPVKETGENYHEVTDTLISKDSLDRIISGIVDKFANENQPIGSCWDIRCKSIMYPAEIQPYVTPELYEEYRVTFNRARAGKKGGGNSNDLILPLTDAECAIPPDVKKSSGGRIRTRKNKHRVNRKYKSRRIKRK